MAAAGRQGLISAPYGEEGENFSCAQWMQENGPGRPVLSVPAVHGAISGDIITVFVLDD